jgi:hypothetical protein
MVLQVGHPNLRSRTVAWLLEQSDPSARYLTLTRLLRENKDALEVRASREAIPRVEPARDILLAQYPQGYWMHPGIGYSPRYRATVWQILVLAQLGMARCPALDRAVHHVFGENQRGDGAFRASSKDGDAPLGLNGSLLWALETLGYGDLPEVRQAWSWVVRKAEARGWDAVSSGDAVKVLWAANAVVPRRLDEGIRRLRRATSHWLLDALPSEASRDSRRFLLTFPLTETTDLLQWTEVLAGAGCGDDPRLAAAKRWLARRRRPDGAWSLERSAGKFWADFGAVGEPNKWITIRALAVCG